MGFGVERNAPCPCGSGKKYKRCCLARDEAERLAASAQARGRFLDHDAGPTTAAGRTAARLHALDDRVGATVLAELERSPSRLRAWVHAYQTEGDSDPNDMQLFPKWLLYHAGLPAPGRSRAPLAGSVAADFVARNPGALGPDGEAWVQAQRAAWLSVWEVVDATPGERLTLEDLLTGERRVVEERQGSRLLPRRAAILARVIEHDGVAVLAGAHSQALPPGSASEVVHESRRALGVRAKRVPPHRLRSHDATLMLLAVWEAVCRAQAAAPPPQLQNTDGDPLCFVRDVFAIEGGAVAEVRRAIQALDGAEADGDAPAWERLTFTRPGGPTGTPEGHTVVGSATVRADELTLETNSIRRADRLRRRVETVVGRRLRHLRRTTQEPQDAMEAAARGRPAHAATEPEIPAEVRRTLEREFLRRHYTAWMDQPLPALGGRTPRAVAANPRTRGAVEALLKDFEFHESQRPDGQVLDVDWLRRELGLLG